MQKRITKVAHKDGRTTIKWVLDRADGSGGTDTFTLDCQDEPRPAFFDALQKIKPWLADWIEIPEAEDGELWHQDIEIKGVSFSYSGEEKVMGAVVTFSKPMQRCLGPLLINTPYKASRALLEDGSDAHKALDPECVEALEALQREAEAYIRGDRAQQTFPFEGESQEETGAAAA